jgi:hypothetical protein
MFNLTGEQKSVTVTNAGNSTLTLNSISYPSTPNWSASLTSPPVNIAPGASVNVTFVRTGASPEAIDFTINSNKTGGNNVVHASAYTRTISYNSLTFPSFTGLTSSATLTVSNTGNSTLQINNITSSNGKFTISPTSGTITSGGSQNFTVTYTPTDFSSQATSITISSDATNASGGISSISTSAQRTQLYQVGVSTGSVVVKPSAQTQWIYVTNTGNVNVTISGGSNSNPSKFTVSTYQADQSTPVSLPRLLTPYTGNVLAIKVVSADGSYTAATGTVSIQNDQGTTYSIQLSRATF